MVPSSLWPLSVTVDNMLRKTQTSHDRHSKRETQRSGVSDLEARFGGYKCDALRERAGFQLALRLAGMTDFGVAWLMKNALVVLTSRPSLTGRAFAYGEQRDLISPSGSFSREAVIISCCGR